jgi:hypothetical protein
VVVEVTFLKSRNGRLLLTALGLLCLAWLITPPMPAPPLYDGVGFPDEPYRYIAPPPGSKPTKPATAISSDTRVTQGRGGEVLANSAEQGPQVLVEFSDGTLTAAPNATMIHVSAQPLAPTVQPGDGTVWGNVYRLTATSDAGPVQVHTGAGTASGVVMRSPAAPPPEPVIEYNNGTGWRQVPTARNGNDIFFAPMAGLGDYAVVRLRNQPAAAGSGGNGYVTPFIIVGVALIVLAGAIVAIRITRSRSGRDTPEGQDAP